MKIRDKKSLNRKNTVLPKNQPGQGSTLDSSEVREYEKDHVQHKGGRFGKKWFPENKKGA